MSLQVAFIVFVSSLTDGMGFNAAATMQKKKRIIIAFMPMPLQVQLQALKNLHAFCQTFESL